MESGTSHSHFMSLPDLASRAAGGAVVWANDELFAEKENLIRPAPPEQRPVSEARLDIHPDGGLARLRLFGRLTDSGLRRVEENWSLSG